MADEIARLGVSVDSSSAVSASKDLDQLAAAGDRATDSAKELKAGWASMTLSPNQLFSANRGLSEFKKELAASREATTQLDQAWKKQTFSDGQLMRANQSLHRFKQELREGAQAAQAAATSNKVVAESHHQVAKAAAGYTKSAKEMAFATRNLPAQFTDIAVSLQAGQNPLTVLLQQGGQLKDMFGGIGPAARAMGGYIAGLVNPYTVAAAAVVGLSVAWIKGDAEGRKFHKTLELQGQSLAVSTSDLIAASERMESFAVTQGKAAEALNATAASGKIFGSNIERVAQVAADLERTAGQAIEKTVEDFASLADDPVQAAIKLDEQYKFLTTSTYEQIKALQDQGDTMGAVQVATDALAATMDGRSKEIEANLGTLQHAWRGVGIMAKWAWDQMMDIGRADSLQEQMRELGDKLREVENPSNFMSYAHLGGKDSQKRKDFANDLRAQLQALSDQYVAEQREITRKRDEQIAATESRSLDQEVRRYASNAQKRELERNRIEEQAKRAREAEARVRSKGWQDRVAEINRDEAAAIAAMEKRLADPKARKTPKSQEARDAERLLRQRAQEYEGLTKALDRHEETLNAAGEAQEKLSAFEKYAIKTLSDLENGHSKLDEAQQAEIKTRIEALRVIDQQNQARDKQNKIMQLSADLHRRIADAEASQSQGHRDELRGIGLGQNEGALEQAMEDIRIRSMRERMDLEEKYQDLRAVGSEQYLADLAAIQDAEARMMNAEIAQMERRKVAMGDWRNGARSAMQDILWDMNDVAGRTRDGFMNAFGAMNNALNNFAQTGKLKMRDFATVVIAELMRIALTIMASKILTSMFGAQASLGGTAANGAILGGSTYGNSNLYAGAQAAATGAVIAGGRRLTTMALGGVTGMVRTSPTLLPMANGGQMLMAEERPEAILPLKRGPNGKLGVEATGGGGNNINVTTNVIVQSDGGVSSKTTTSGEDSETFKRLGSMIEGKVLEVLVDQRRQGGLLWGMANGR